MDIYIKEDTSFNIKHIPINQKYPPLRYNASKQLQKIPKMARNSDKQVSL